MDPEPGLSDTQAGERPLFPPPAEAAALYIGEVMHARLKPIGHRFAYRVFSLLIDLDQLPKANRASLFFSVDKANLVSFRQKDHGEGPNLRAYVERVLEPCNVDLSGGRVLLLCYPRLFGYAFNPLSVYYAYDRANALKAVIYEVRNTFGERHTYVCPVEPGMLTEAGLRQERDKIFYVSPFMDMAMRYRFRLLPPGDEVRVRILEEDKQGPILSATFAGSRRELTTRHLLGALVGIPFMAGKVMAGIHWEALKLWIKGLRIRSRPAPPPPVSYDATGEWRTMPLRQTQPSLLDAAE